ncbi:hypothetical protein [Streptomyces sp. NBC_00162]|uniref:hypothetical protein n=1 Tax=Streptomyces sp. NBC_00162 TaxID=2903629 RepID=UPI00214AB8AC|nr:hypothetical protein [Streptomyces sp. NBC_00162]UUU43707.1 hypothetical protein JIW86_35755 [Streptomyces sp. NBC_00162]
MKDRPGFGLRARGCVVAGLFVLAGCSGGGGGGGADAAKGAASRTPSASPASSASSGTGSTGTPTAPGASGAPLVPELDESRQPKTAAEARALLGRIVIGQAAFGPEVERATPFESDPRRWPVLDQDCVWQTEGLPPDVLATSTRYFQIPAKDGHGRVLINATVTVHHDRQESGWETARAMEEVLRCPDQKLRDGEDLKGLWGGALHLGEQMNGWTEDAFTESGKYVSAAQGGGPQPYIWSQGQFGPVTLAVAGKGAEGFADAALNALVVQGTSRLMVNTKQELAKAAP